jgi:hypothetical protein
MKKIYLMVIGFAIATIYPATAQENISIATGEVQSEQVEQTAFKNGNGLPSAQALWDVQFNYNLFTSVGSNGNAGVAYTGTEFWVSKWANDSIYTLSPTGALTAAFTIPGVAGVRAFTWDGQYLYAGKATDTIAVIDPMTKTLTNSIIVSGGHIVRHITYDSTANSGSGGFWIGDFNTPLRQIDMSGNVLNTIPAGTHGLQGMYGSAIDHWTSGAPYLWIFYQSGGASDPQKIKRLQLPTGMPTGVDHNVMTDVGASVSGGLAGGLFITNQLDTVRTMIGLLQGSPNRLFGYELNDYVVPAFDAALDTLRPSVPYYQIPQVHTVPTNFTGSVRNAGINTMSGTLNIDVSQAGSSVFTSAPAFSNLASGSSANVTSTTSYLPAAIGVYNVTGNVSIANDASALNDTIKFSFLVTDTVFARENEIVASSSLGIGSGNGGFLGQRFTTNVNDIATSISFYLNSPAMDDTVNASLYTFTTTPGTILATTPNYIIQAADTNGTWITLPFNTGPLNLSAGNYFLAVKEYSSNVTLGTTSSNFTPGAGWVLFGANPWNTTEFYGFKRTYLLRLNVAGINTGINNLGSNEVVHFYPNPTTGKVNIVTEKTIKKITVTNILGELMYLNHNAFSKQSLDLSHLSTGIYFIKVEGNDFVNMQKILIEN